MRNDLIKLDLPGLAAAYSTAEARGDDTLRAAILAELRRREERERVLREAAESGFDSLEHPWKAPGPAICAIRSALSAYQEPDDAR